MIKGQRELFADIEERAGRYRQALAAEGIGLALLQQLMDKYYLSGTIQRGFLAVAPDRDPVLFCLKAVERAQEETPWEVRPLGSPRELPGLLAEEGFHTDARIGFESDVIPLQLYAQLQRMFPDSRLVDCGLALRRVRQVKTAFELAELRDAGKVWMAMMEATRCGIRPGVDDQELTALIESEGRKAGSQGIVRTRAFNFEYFGPQVCAGPPGAVPTHFDGPTAGLGPHPVIAQGGAHRPIAAGEPVLVDFAAGVRGYTADGTRTFAIGGLPAELDRAAKVALDILGEAEEAIRPGASLGDIYRRAVQRAAEEGLAEHFMGYGPDRVRFLGHGVGLELDELPVLVDKTEEVFVPGMVVALEPKFVFPGVGAVGIEDTFIAREHGPAEVITTFPRAPFIPAGT